MQYKASAAEGQKDITRLINNNQQDRLCLLVSASKKVECWAKGGSWSQPVHICLKFFCQQDECDITVVEVRLHVKDKSTGSSSSTPAYTLSHSQVALASHRQSILERR